MAAAAQFDLVPSAVLTSTLLKRDSSNEEDGSSYDQERPFNDNFNEMGYQSVNFIDTLSPMFYYEFFFCFSTVLVIVVKSLSGRSGDGE